jgi:hypothetical protein
MFINEWTERKVDIQVEFEDPSQISKGDSNDQFQVDIKKPNYFVSKASGEVA